MKADFSGFDFNSLTGEYLNSETNTKIKIEYLSDKRYQILVADRNPWVGQLISPSKLLVGNYTLAIEDKGSSLQSLLLNGDRIKNVKF